MKVGFIFECGPEGADVKVVGHLARRLQPKLVMMARTLDNKPKLIEGCGKAARQLLDAGCEKVFVVWDLFPAWREDKEKPCRAEDRRRIFETLQKEGVQAAEVILLCIEEELEAWLIADGNALSAFLSTETRKVTIGHVRNPDREKNPKKKLGNLFKEHRGNSFKYEDYRHAERIVPLITDFSRLKRSESFSRFHFKLTGALPK